MTDRHKHPPLRIRPNERVRERLARYIERTGRRVNAVANEALDDFLAKHEPETTSPESEDPK